MVGELESLRKRSFGSQPEKSDPMANKPVKIGRDAKSGEFIPVKEAVRRPSTTTVETIKPGKRK